MSTNKQRGDTSKDKKIDELNNRIQHLENEIATLRTLHQIEIEDRCYDLIVENEILLMQVEQLTIENNLLRKEKANGDKKASREEKVRNEEKANQDEKSSSEEVHQDVMSHDNKILEKIINKDEDKATKTNDNIQRRHSNDNHHSNPAPPCIIHDPPDDGTIDSLAQYPPQMNQQQLKEYFQKSSRLRMRSESTPTLSQLPNYRPYHYDPSYNHGPSSPHDHGPYRHDSSHNYSPSSPYRRDLSSQYCYNPSSPYRQEPSSHNPSSPYRQEPSYNYRLSSQFGHGSSSSNDRFPTELLSKHDPPAMNMEQMQEFSRHAQLNREQRRYHGIREEWAPVEMYRQNDELRQLQEDQRRKKAIADRELKELEELKREQKRIEAERKPLPSRYLNMSKEPVINVRPTESDQEDETLDTLEQEIRDAARQVRKMSRPPNTEEVMKEDDDSSLPYDPNLVCPKCGIMYRIGQIQYLRRHLEEFCPHLKSSNNSSK